jgi:hypothetical protein
MGTDCERCHSVRGWQISVQSIREHQNRFPLMGVHAAVECESCHKGAAVGQFQGLSTACSSCHLKEFQQTNNPSHLAMNFPTTCETCHLMDNWAGAKFDHLKFTGYALTGAHALLDCVACHVGNKFVGTPTDCASCHIKNYNATTNPNHVQAGFPTTCASCHTTIAWSPASFDHNKTRFPLTGAHVSVTCNACHIGGNFNNTPMDCAACHIKNFNSTTNPNHVQAGFPTTCVMCHTTIAWSPANFDHSKTVFPLTGFHVSVPCNSCHVGGNFATAPTDCAGCHLKNYNATTNPNHAQAGFPTTCAVCHTTTAWSPATFDHNKTVFPLTGFHVNVACTSCHLNGNYTTAPTDCAGCHLKDYNAATNPNHAQLGFPTTCVNCHTTTAWQPSTFDHSKTTFPLTGFHVTVACNLCHVGGNFTTVPTDCYSCHKATFIATTSPNHVAAGFPTDCSICHTTTSWAGAVFDHSKTPFPLTGFHVNVACPACHVNNVFVGLSTACVSCHLNNFNTATSPNHVASGFPQTCELCHTTAAWIPATFDHNKTAFPLTGFHVTVPCSSCHMNANYKATPTDCYSCHKANYLGATNPNHIGAGFSTACQTCHNTTAWTGAIFNHTFFVLPHHNAQCFDCHIVPTAYVNFSCTATCHPQASTDPRHSGVSGYVYAPTSCYRCHKS